MSEVDVQKAIRETLQFFASKNQCKIYPLRSPSKGTYYFLDAVSRQIRVGGVCSAGPTWMWFAVGGEGMNRDLMVRTEMLIGEVDDPEAIAFALATNYDKTPFYALRFIEKRPFLFIVIDALYALAVGQQSLEDRLTMDCVLNMLSDSAPGVNVHPDVLTFAIKRHRPKLQDVEKSSVLDSVFG